MNAITYKIIKKKKTVNITRLAVTCYVLWDVLYIKKFWSILSLSRLCISSLSICTNASMSTIRQQRVNPRYTSTNAATSTIRYLFLRSSISATQAEQTVIATRDSRHAWAFRDLRHCACVHVCQLILAPIAREISLI